MIPRLPRLPGSRPLRAVVAGALFVALAGCTDSTPATAPGDAPETSRSTTTAATEPPPNTLITEDVRFPMDATIAELQRALRNGRITSVELVDYYLARIEAYDDAGPELSALITINPRARAEAAALDSERAASGPRGPLHGIALLVKDNINTAEMRTTSGSRVLEHFQPARDAFQVRKLREAGAIILGKANLAELAQSSNSYSTVGGQTLSPYDTTREPGGSSGGTAVAVAANFAVAGLGQDTCGSIRHPAGLNNVYGLRPTHGLSSRAGSLRFSSTLDELGPMTRTVGDLAIIVDITSGEDPEDPATMPTQTSLVDALDPGGLKGRRIGVLEFDYRNELDGVLQDALDVMVANGAELVPISLPEPAVNMDPILGEFPSSLAAYLAKEPTAPRRAWARIVGDPGASRRTPDTREYRKAVAGRMGYRRDLEAVMDRHDVDAVAYPVSSTTASVIVSPGQDDDSGHFSCGQASIAGLPALAMPAGFASDGLPVGLELLGRAFDEATLVSIASGFEAHTDHRGLPASTPPLPTEG
jgi:amidase